MKCFVIFSVVLVVVKGLSSTEEFFEKMKHDYSNHVNECQEELHSNPTDLQQILHHIIPSSHNGKCMLACMAKKCGMLDESGQIDADKLKEFPEEIKEADQDLYDKLTAIAENCVEHVQNADDECDTAANLFSCINRGIRAAGLQKDFLM